jgi:hypothetical protein
VTSPHSVAAYLAEVREAEQAADVGEWHADAFSITARTAVPRLLAAVEAALAHHNRSGFPVDGEYHCLECTAAISSAAMIVWPCPKYRAISSELLKGSSDGG